MTGEAARDSHGSLSEPSSEKKCEMRGPAMVSRLVEAGLEKKTGIRSCPAMTGPHAQPVLVVSRTRNPVVSHRLIEAVEGPSYQIPGVCSEWTWLN